MLKDVFFERGGVWEVLLDLGVSVVVEIICLGSRYGVELDL
jgi:hypothetical protein